MKKYLALLLSISSISAFADYTYVTGAIGDNTSSNNFAGTVNIGYGFNQYFAVEGGTTLSGNSTSNSYGIIDAAARGTLPLTDLFSLYGRLGVATNLYSSNGYNPIGDGVGALVGVGGEFNFSRSFALTLEDYFITSGSNYLMLGGQFRF